MPGDSGGKLVRPIMETSDQATGATAIDPVCGMKVVVDSAKFQTEHASTKYYFCCGGCLAKFSIEPAKYLAKPAGSGLVTIGLPMAKPALVTLGAPGHAPPVAQPAAGADIAESR